MFRPRKRGKALGAALLALGLISPPVAGAEPAPAVPAGTAADAHPRTVTLVTGDRVVVTGAAVGSFQPGPGRDKVTFHSTHRDGRLSVVPEDAARGIASGRLDPRLFDVTGLIEAGYDDARTDHVPLIVTGTPSGLRAARALPGASATKAPKAEVGATFRALLADPGVTRVWLDGVLRPTLDRSTAQIGAPTAWRAGYTGKGVKVAVLDGGVDGAHPDLRGREVAERNFTDDPDATDLTGHGTHVAATIASGDRTYRGVAPDARILDGKVCGGNGGCSESSILAGVQWAVDEGADIVNLSLGGYDSPGVDPLEDAINRLTAKTGTLFVVAAGNGGRSRSIDSPGSADAALTVGAVRHDDDLAHFSSRGPRNGDDAVKPDITAPGLNIVAAKAAQGVLGTPVGRRHASLSGTSMATPHVAGAAALLAQQHPDWTGAQLKAALMASAKPNPALGVFDQGAGRVDVTRALTATTGAEPVSLTFEEQSWPHHDDTPVTKAVTYRNSGPEPITFDLAVELRGPRGTAPEGLVTVNPAHVTVPAGGTTTVAVTADTRVGTVDGVFSGVLVGGPTRVPLSLAREVESYDVAIEHIDAEGNPALDNSVALVGMDNDFYENLYGPDGTATARVPKGEYMARAVIRAWPRTWVLARPTLTVDADRTRYTFDARVAKPLRVTAPDPAATPMIGDINVSRVLNGRRVVLNTAFLGGFGDMAIGHVGPTLTAEELTVSVGAQYQAPPVDGTPTHYRFRWMEQGAVPTGYTRAPTRDELTEVRTAFAPGPADRQYLHSGNASPPDGSGGWAVGLPVPAGGAVVDLVTPDRLTWSWGYQRLSPQYRTEADYSSFHRRYRLGERYAERFAHPVLGPGLAGYSATYLGVHEDRVTAQVPLINDRDGNLGRGDYRSARTSVYRDGRLVGQVRDQWGEFTVPEGEGRYRVEHELVRDPAAHELTTRVSGAWTFPMATLPDGQGRRLPLSVVRFEPRLDAGGGTPAGRLLSVPLAVEQQDGADNGEVGEVRVDVSFDDGANWRRVPVAGGAALVRHPDAAGYVSLRASGVDSDGNTFEHTVIRAYKITR